MSGARRPASGREASRGALHDSRAALNAPVSRPRTAKARIERAMQPPRLSPVAVEPAWPARPRRREPTLADMAPPARHKALRLSKSAGGSIETTARGMILTSPLPKKIRPATGHHARRTLMELLQRDDTRGELSMPRNLTGLPPATFSSRHPALTSLWCCRVPGGGTASRFDVLQGRPRDVESVLVCRRCPCRSAQHNADQLEQQRLPPRERRKESAGGRHIFTFSSSRCLRRTTRCLDKTIRRLRHCCASP